MTNTPMVPCPRGGSRSGCWADKHYATGEFNSLEKCRAQMKLGAPSPSARTTPTAGFGSTAPLAMQVPPPGDSLMISQAEHGDDLFTNVQIYRADESDDLRADVEVGLWVDGGLALALDLERDSDELKQYVDDNSHLIEAYLQDRYGATDVDLDDLYYTSATFEVDLPADVSERTLSDAIHAATDDKLLALYNESDPGAFGSINMWADMTRQIDEHHERVAEIAQQSLETALWSGTDDRFMRAQDSGDYTGFDEVYGEKLDFAFDVDDFDESAVAKMREDLSMFLTYNRETIARIQESHPEFTDSQIGRDFLLSRDGAGAGFYDRGFGDDGDKLQEATRRFGSFETYIGDDGKLYAM